MQTSKTQFVCRPPHPDGDVVVLHLQRGHDVLHPEILRHQSVHLFLHALRQAERLLLLKYTRIR